MKVEQCISHTYTVHLSTKGNRSESFRFDFKPSISDVFAAMKIIAHKGESQRIDMEILTQMLVLIKTPDFRRMVELGQGWRDELCLGRRCPDRLLVDRSD
jgi:hypothetical protein